MNPNMDCESIHIYSWVESHLKEQRKLVREFLSLQEQGAVPSIITAAHMRRWILCRARAAFLTKFQERADWRNLYLVEMTLMARSRLRLSEIEQRVLNELPGENAPSAQPEAAHSHESTTLLKAFSDIGAKVNGAAVSGIKVMPKPMVVHTSTVKHIISQVLLQINHQAFQRGVSLKLGPLVNDAQDLLWSFPWVQVTEEKQLASALQRSTDVYEVARVVLDKLEQVLAPRYLLKQALGVWSNILLRYVAHLVALEIASRVPDQCSAKEEEGLISQRMAKMSPLPPKFVVSGQLVEEIVTELLLKVYPLNGHVKWFGYQGLPALCAVMSEDTTDVLEKIPGVTLDAKLRPPLFNMTRTIQKLQNSLVWKCVKSTPLIDLVVMGDREVFVTVIPYAVIEEIFIIYISIAGLHIPDVASGVAKRVGGDLGQLLENPLVKVSVAEPDSFPMGEPLTNPAQPSYGGTADLPCPGVKPQEDKQDGQQASQCEEAQNQTTVEDTRKPKKKKILNFFKRLFCMK